MDLQPSACLALKWRQTGAYRSCTKISDLSPRGVAVHRSQQAQRTPCPIPIWFSAGLSVALQSRFWSHLCSHRLCPPINLSYYLSSPFQPGVDTRAIWYLLHFLDPLINVTFTSMPNRPNRQSAAGHRSRVPAVFYVHRLSRPRVRPVLFDALIRGLLGLIASPLIACSSPFQRPHSVWSPLGLAALYTLLPFCLILLALSFGFIITCLQP